MGYIPISREEWIHYLQGHRPIIDKDITLTEATKTSVYEFSNGKLVFVRIYQNGPFDDRRDCYYKVT